MSREKQKTVYYTVFRNIPYSDEEWNLLKERLRFYPESYRNRLTNTRPNRSFQYGPSCHTEEEARAICEAASRRGAQRVEYSSYTHATYTQGDIWYKTKNKEWKRKARR